MLAVRFISFALMDGEWNSSSSPWYYFGATREVFIVLVAVGGAALVGIIWALFFYKGGPRRSHPRSHFRHHSRRLPQVRPSNGEIVTAPAAAHPPKRHWRRRRREHRQRNPTLAETRGLPPMRAERPPEPFP
jgi:hypothetical protein